MFRPSKTIEVSIEETHHHVLKFVYGDVSYKKFMETGTVFDTRRSGRPRTSEENIECVRQAFQCSPMKSIHTAARQLELPHSTVHKVLHKNLRLYAYKAQMLQALQPNDMPRQKEFAVTCCNKSLRIKHSSSEFVLVIRQLFMSQES